MQITIAKNSGFCHGVKKAVDTVLQINPDNLYIYGQLIHNESVVEEIEKKGIQTVEDLASVPSGATLVFRSHGVGKNIYKLCEEKNIQVIDCTCSFVKRTQKLAEKYSKEGKTIVVVGKKTHPEVIGICGWCTGDVYVFESIEEDFSVLKDKEVVLLAQTTYKEEKFEEIVKKIQKEYAKTVEIFKTICYTTTRRQKEATKLAQEHDAVLIIGGQNSSNTQTLYDACKKHCNAVFKITDVHTFQYHRLKKFKNIAIVSGASTPITQMQEVLFKMTNSIESQEQNLEMKEIVAKMENSPKLKIGEIITGIISSATEDGVQILLQGLKKEILLPKNELETDNFQKEDYLMKIGDEIEVIVTGLMPVTLSQKAITRLKEEEKMLDSIKEGAEFSAVCNGTNKAGLLASFGTYGIFIPAKEIRMGYVSDLNEYVGRTLRLKAIEIKVSDRKKEIIASQRVVLEEERAQKNALKEQIIQNFFANVHEGDIVEGKVERVTDFGAFVSVRGFDCLAHISDLSWQTVKKVTDILTIGETYQFKVLKIDQENKKVAIGYKQMQPQPWNLVAMKYSVGDVIQGTVVRIVPFGLFVEVEKGVDGLVHLSEISHEWLENPIAAVSIGEEIQAKILHLDPDNKKMTLSIKALLPAPEITKVRPRREKSEGNNNFNSHNKHHNRAHHDNNESREWKDSSMGGASIAEMLNSKND